MPERFPEVVEDAAAEAVGAGPSADAAERVDRLDLDLVTIDPPGSQDLDQAFHAERRAGGYVVHYAIADVAAYVGPASPLAAEAWVRGATLYSPGHRAPLYPDLLGEGAASLLPARARPVVLWTIDIDDDGQIADVVVERALVRSRAQLTYRDAQDQIDEGRPLPEWVEPGFDELPDTMDRARRHQGRLDRASVDYMEAMVLLGREGEVFEAVVTAVDDDGEASVQLADPAVIARADGLEVEAGVRVSLRLEAADEDAGRVRFVPAD